MKRIFLIDNGCYSTKCSVINYDPSTTTGTEEVRIFPTALDYTDGEYNIINEDNGGASIIRYFRAFFGMTKEAAQVKAEKLFPFMDIVYDNNGFAAISLSEGSKPVSCIELTKEYVKKLYEKMNGDNKVDYVYFALPKEFDEETCNLFKREVRSCIHATCSFVSYTDLLLIAAERKQVLSVDIGASMLNVSLLRDNEVERTKSFILGSGYALDTAIVEFIKKEMGIVVNEEKRYVNVFLMQMAEKVRRTLDTAQEAQVDLTDISTFITCDRSIMTVRSNQLNTILSNYKKDLAFNIDLVRSIPGVDNSKSKLVLSGGMASQRFLKDCLGDLDKADEGLDKTLVTLQSLTLFFKKDQNTPILTLSSPAEESADSFVIDDTVPSDDESNAPITPVSPVNPASAQPSIPASAIPPPPVPEIPPPSSVVDDIPPPPIPVIPSSPPEPDIPSPPPMPVTEFPPPPPVVDDIPPPPPSVVNDMPPPPPVINDMPPPVVDDMPTPTPIPPPPPMEIPPPPSVVIPPPMPVTEMPPPPSVVGDVPPPPVPDMPLPPPEPTMAMEIPPPMPEVPPPTSTAEIPPPPSVLDIPSRPPVSEMPPPPPPIPEVPSPSSANEIPPPPIPEVPSPSSANVIPPPPPSGSEMPPPPPPEPEVPLPPMPATEVPLPPIPTISPIDAPPSPPEVPPPVPTDALLPNPSFVPPPIPVLRRDSPSRSPDDLSLPPPPPPMPNDSFGTDTGIPAPPPPVPSRVNDPPLIYSDPPSSYRSTDSLPINSIPSDDVSEEVATPMNTQIPTPKPVSIMTGKNELPLPMYPLQVTAVKKTDKPVSSYGVDVPSEPRVRIPAHLTSVGEDSLSNQGESMSPPDSPLLPAEKGQSLPPMVPKAPLLQNPPARPTSPPPTASSVITTSFASPSPMDSIQAPHPMSFTSPEASLQGPTAPVVNDTTTPPSYYPISEKPQKPIAQSSTSEPIIVTPLPLPQHPTPTHVDPIMPPPPPPVTEPVNPVMPPPPQPPTPTHVDPIMPPPPPPVTEPPKLEYDIVDEKGNIIFAKGSPLDQIASAEVKATFYQLVFRKEFFKMAEQKERLGTCICQLERGLRGGTVLHVDYVLKNGNISFEVTYNHNGKTIKEERTMKCSVC